MESQDTPAAVPNPDDQVKVQEQVVDPWNVSGAVGEDGNLKPIGLWTFSHLSATSRDRVVIPLACFKSRRLLISEPENRWVQK